MGQEAKGGCSVGNSLSQVGWSFGSFKVFPLENSCFSWRMLWAYFTGVGPLSLYQSLCPILASLYENLVMFQVVKICENLGPFSDCGFLEFLTLMLVHNQPPAIFQNNHFSIPTSLWFQWFLLLLNWYWLWLWIFLCLQIWGWSFALQSQFSNKFKKSCWFSFFPAFFFL